jgi:hypothetical protein
MQHSWLTEISSTRFNKRGGIRTVAFSSTDYEHRKINNQNILESKWMADEVKTYS